MTSEENRRKKKQKYWIVTLYDVRCMEHSVIGNRVQRFTMIVTIYKVIICRITFNFLCCSRYDIHSSKVCAFFVCTFLRLITFIVFSWLNLFTAIRYVLKVDGCGRGCDKLGSSDRKTPMFNTECYCLYEAAPFGKLLRWPHRAYQGINGFLKRNSDRNHRWWPDWKPNSQP